MGNTLGGIIKKTIEIGTEEIFQDSKKFNSLIDDLAPELTTERKVFHRAVSDEVLVIFATLRNNKDNSNEHELLRIKNKLENDYGLSESWSVLLVAGFADAFDIEHNLTIETHDNKLREETIENTEAKRNTHKTIPEDISSQFDQRRSELFKQKELLLQERNTLGLFSHKRKTEIDRMLSDIDRELGFSQNNNIVQTQVQTKAKNLQSFQVSKVDTFSSDGTLVGKRTSGYLFLKGETSHIGIKVYFQKENSSRTANLVWRIYRDGTSFSGDIKVSVPIGPTDDHLFHQWGWPTVGNWPVGRYKVVATINGSSQVQCSFEIRAGIYDSLQTPLKSLKLFNGSIPAPPIERREYTSTFNQSTLKCVYFQIEFPHPNSKKYITFDYLIKDPNGKVIVNSSCPVEINTNHGVYWNGYGWDTPGHWVSGEYT